MNLSKKKRDTRKPAKSKCRDCGAEQTIPRYAYFRASQPRCTACGGLLDYQGGWQGSTRRGVGGRLPQARKAPATIPPPAVYVQHKCATCTNNAKIGQEHCRSCRKKMAEQKNL